MDAVQIIITQGAAATAVEGAAALGVLKWFGDKIFGPSANALGENLRAFLADRVGKIFYKAGEMAQAMNIDPGPIRPGLLTRMIVDASFSEDVDDITDWWANLFLDASLAESNEHAVFSDIMASLGPREATCLEAFVQSFPHSADPNFGRSPAWMDVHGSKFEGAVSAWIGGENIVERHNQIVQNFLFGDPSWPMRPTEWKLPLKPTESDEPRLFYGHDPWYVKNVLPVEILKRSGVLMALDVTLPIWGGSAWVRGISLTNLGYEFYRAIKGLKRS